MKKSLIATMTVLALGLSGCATSSLLDAPKATTGTKTVKSTLIEDKVVAFGRPAPSANVAQNSVVIVGETHSYVLNDGGTQLVNLITSLNPKNFQVNNALEFYSANDGKFSGKMALSYVALKDDISKADLQTLVQNSATECSNQSDVRMNAQRFCFDIAINGVIYPKVSNYDLVRSQFSPLTRPYSVTIYTTNTEQTYQGRSSAEKLVLLPFALAFDVVTLPVQILGALGD